MASLKTVCTTDTVDVTWGDGSTTSLPNLWLRDNCGCDDCRITQTDEKKFILTSVDADIAPTEATVDADVLVLAWPDGHRTTYTADFIRSVTTENESAIRYWSGDFQPRRVDYAAFCNDPTVAIETISEFLATGVVVLVGAPTESNLLEDLADHLGPLREVLFDRIHNVQLDPAGYNVAHTSLPLPPHNDFASYSWPPSVQALHFLANETPGGDSIVVDGWQVLETLRREEPAMFDALCTMPVPFREFDDDNETYATAPMVVLDPDGSIARFRFSNQLMQPMNPTQPGVSAFYRAYHELCKRITDDAMKSRFRMEGGSILLVASHRVLHARDEFEPTGRRHLQDAYFEHDNVRNHLTVLQRKAMNR